jgi:hypothetical protein
MGEEGTMKTTVLTLIAIAGVLALVSAGASEISVDHHAGVDFSRYKTYAWKAGTDAPNLDTHKRIVASVDQTLQAKGLTKVEKDPDLWVSYQVVSKQEATSTDWDYGKFKFRGRDVTVQKLVRGTLALDLVDADFDALVWRGAATEYLTPDAPPAEGVIEKAVSLMFSKYPPGKE